MTSLTFCATGRFEANAATEDRLLALTCQTDADLFAPRSARLAQAYRNQAQRITKTAVARNRDDDPEQKVIQGGHDDEDQSQSRAGDKLDQ